MARNGGDVHDGTASVLASSSSSSRRSENLQRLIDSADQSVNLLASLDSWAPDASTGSAAASQSSSAAFNPFASGSSSYLFGASSSNSNSQPHAHGDAAAYDDNDDLNVVDLSVQRGMLHVKGVFPDHSVEYADIDPRFTTIGDLKRVLCEKRNSKKDLGFTAGDARVMFNGQLVENDWLVVDCGLGVDGVIYVVKALPTGAYFSGGAGSGFAGRAGDARLPVASIASSYAQQQQQKQHRTRQQKEADEDSMLVEFNETLALDTTQSGQLSHKVRPEESNFAEMLSDFYQNLDNVHDTDSYGERLLRGYIDVLQSRLEHVEASVEGSSRFAAQQRQRLHDSIKELRDERNTWRLLYELRRICHSANANGADDMLMDMTEDPEDVRFDMVEGDVVRLLETHNENYKIQKAVKTWLENIAMENTVAVNDKRSVAKHGTRTLKMAKKGFIARSDVCLDPDAVLRDGDRHVVDDDAEDEADLLKGVWSFVRAGNLEQAVDLCVRVGEPWRAASLSGGIQVGAASDMDDDDRSLERWGNPMRALWKTTCWKFAEAKNLKLSKRNSVQSRQYEEIIYAALSGNVQVLTQSTLSESWEDHCWAYLHAMTEQQIDETLHKLLKVKLQSSQLVVGNDAHYLRLYRALLDKTTYLKRYQVNLDALFDDLRNSKSDVVRKQAQEPYRQIQAKLVTAKIESIVTSVANGLIADDNSEPFDWKLRIDEHVPADDVTPFFLRFAAHFVLFASFTEEKMDEMANHMVVKAYIRHLVKHGHFKLVPIYASRLPVDGSIEVYVQVLGSLDDRLERELFLRRIHEFASIDVLTAVVTTTVERLSAEYSRQVRQSAAHAQDVTSRVDRKRMRLIEFLCFYNDHRAEALRRANFLAREFVIEGKFSAVKELLIEHVPEDSIGLVNLHRGIQSVEDDEIERILRGHLCWKAYIRACHHYDLWRSCTAGRSETSWKAYSEEKEFLTELMYHVSRSTVAIVDVLQFEDGWLLHCSDHADHDASVRRACLPLLALHLHFIQLESAKLVLRLQFYPTPAKVQLVQPLLEKSLQVADVVADEHYAVSDVLTPAHCQELLNGFRESAIALLHLESMAPMVDEIEDDGGEQAPQETIQPTEL